MIISGFLDEVGELAPEHQVKLLGVIDGGGYTPVGDNKVKKTDVRIIAATNRDLSEIINKGLMREDFFYRIRKRSRVQRFTVQG